MGRSGVIATILLLAGCSKELGRKPEMTPEQIAEAHALIAGGLKAEAVAARYDVGRATVFRNLQGLQRVCL